MLAKLPRVAETRELQLTLPACEGRLYLTQAMPSIRNDLAGGQGSATGESGRGF